MKEFRMMNEELGEGRRGFRILHEDRKSAKMLLSGFASPVSLGGLCVPTLASFALKGSKQRREPTSHYRKLTSRYREVDTRYR